MQSIEQMSYARDQSTCVSHTVPQYTVRQYHSTTVTQYTSHSTVYTVHMLVNNMLACYHMLDHLCHIYTLHMWSVYCDCVLCTVVLWYCGTVVLCTVVLWYCVTVLDHANEHPETT